LKDIRQIQQLLIAKDYDAVFNWLVRTHSRILYLRVRSIVGTHEDADDILQDSFIKIWKHLPSFRGDSSLSTWSYQIATRTAIDFTRSEGKKAVAFGALELNDGSRAPIQDSHMDYRAGMERLIDAIDSLPAQQRYVFVLRYFEGSTYEEIQTLCGTSVGGLKANYHHASTYIKKFLRH
jgi:RNA polymerase sigma-70 factor (ECF subfamily)